MTTQKINPPVWAHEAGLKNETETAIVATDDGTDRQAFALLKWQAGRIQQELVKVPSGYLISRWSMTRHCTDLGEVKAVLLRMGAAK